MAHNLGITQQGSLIVLSSRKMCVLTMRGHPEAVELTGRQLRLALRSRFHLFPRSVRAIPAPNILAASNTASSQKRRVNRPRRTSLGRTHAYGTRVSAGYALLHPFVR